MTTKFSLAGQRVYNPRPNYHIRPPSVEGATMRADKLTLGRVFDHPERLEAPLFQRPYVWNEERNWEPLWESMQAILSRRLSKTSFRPHFLGAIVLDQMSTPTGKIPCRQIIDGQQRLTTLQVALAAARDLAFELNQDKYREAFKQLTQNHVPLSDDPDDVLKVWPTNADRTAFRKTLHAQSAKAVQELVENNGIDSKIAPAYLYFSENFRAWIQHEAQDQIPVRLDTLYTMLKDDLHLVVIDLDKEDDAQEIFETLNALGTPLLPADLVKNFLFHRAQAEKADAPKLYRQYWEAFETEQSYWRQEIRQGRLKRARLDLFLSHYLTLLTGEDIIISQMFLAYRDHVQNNGTKTAADHMSHFRTYADIYRTFDSAQPDTREHVFFTRMEDMDTTTMYPLLLEVFQKNTGGPGRAESLSVLTDLESFFVRRAVCDLTTRSYNRVFAEFIKQLHGTNYSHRAIRDLLLAETADASRWPDDNEFETAWMSINFYKRLKKSKQRMILEAIEAALYDERTEDIKIERQLTIEHLLPVEWEEHWPLVITTDTPEARDQAKKRRTDAIHKIGNLSLLTKKLNPAVSNGPWAKKRTAILKHSALNLNRPLQDLDIWNEDAIEQRSRELLNIAKNIWPHP